MLKNIKKLLKEKQDAANIIIILRKVMDFFPIPFMYYRKINLNQLAVEEPPTGNLINLEGPYDYQAKAIEGLKGSSDPFELSGDKSN